MINDNEAPVISCPTCEYRYGHGGQAVSHAKGLLTCNVCNSKWRDLNNSQYTGGKSKRHGQPFMAQAAPADVRDINDLGQLKPDHQIRHRSGFCALSVAISCALIILVVVGGYQILVWDDFSRQAKIQTSALTLDNIKVENRSNNQLPFWTITARITNKTVHSVTVPPILMKSGNKGSSGYFGWTYTPALQKLAPGTNLIIRSSIHKPFGSSKIIEMEFADNNLKSG